MNNTTIEITNIPDTIMDIIDAMENEFYTQIYENKK